MNRYFLIVGGFVALLVVFAFGLTRNPGELPSTHIDRAAPAFELPSLLDPDRRVSLAQFAGGPLLLNVWATWCVECRHEHEFLMQLEAAGQLPILGLNWRDNRADALRWLQQLGDPYVDSAFDADGRVALDWGVYGAPETFLVDADGIVLHRHTGALTAAIWERDFAPLLESAGP